MAPLLLWEMACRARAQLVRDERLTHADWQADTNNKFDVNTYGVICDRLGRLFDRLGLERRPRDVVTLEGYLDHAKDEAT